MDMGIGFFFSFLHSFFLQLVFFVVYNQWAVLSYHIISSRCRTQSVEPNGKETELLGKARLVLTPDHMQPGFVEEGAKLVVGAGDTAIDLVVDIIALHICREILLDNNQPGVSQTLAAAHQVIHHLRICQMAQTPLIPDQIVRRRRRPILQTRHEDIPNPPLIIIRNMQRRILANHPREILDGLDNINHRTNPAQEPVCDAPDARATVHPARKHSARLRHGGNQTTQFGEEIGGAAEVDSRDLGVAA